MCFKPSLASTCLSQALNLSCIVLHHLFHFYCDSVSPKTTDRP